LLFAAQDFSDFFLGHGCLNLDVDQGLLLWSDVLWISLAIGELEILDLKISGWSFCSHIG
jgi:hypothetical protein